MKLDSRLTVTFFFSVVFLCSCQKEKEQVARATELSFAVAQSMTEMDAMFAAGYDLSRKISYQLPYEVIPSAAKVVFIDSLFSDGNGLQFTIDFGPLGRNSPKGLLCLDGRRRAGVLDCELSKPLDDSGAILIIKNLNSFYTGNGYEMFSIEGDLSVSRDHNGKLLLMSNLVLQEPSIGSMGWSSNLEIADERGTRYYLGTAKGVSVNNQSFLVEIDNAIVKAKNCSTTFTEGTCHITSGESKDRILLDFNPYSGSECDRIARARINNYEKIFYIY